MKDGYASSLVAEAENLTEKVLRLQNSPTPKASIFNRCIEALSRVGELRRDEWSQKAATVLAHVADGDCEIICGSAISTHRCYRKRAKALLRDIVP